MSFRRPVSLNGAASVVGFRTFLPQGIGEDWKFTQSLLEASPGTLVRGTPGSAVNNFLLPMIPWLMILGFIWLFVVRPLRKNNNPRRPMPVVIVNPEEP